MKKPKKQRADPLNYYKNMAEYWETAYKNERDSAANQEAIARSLCEGLRKQINERDKRIQELIQECDDTGTKLSGAEEAAITLSRQYGELQIELTQTKSLNKACLLLIMRLSEPLL